MKKAFFVHIPKTAGSSLWRVYGKKHIFKRKTGLTHQFGFDGVKSNIPIGNFLKDKNWGKKDFSFTVIRNPFDQLVSYYFHAQLDGWASVNKVNNFKSFDEFLKAYCFRPSADWHIPLLSSNLFAQIFDVKGDSLLDYCIFFENLDDGIYELFSKLDHNFKFSKVPNKRPSVARKKKDYRLFYSDKTREMVEKKCKWELDTFGYSFDEKQTQIIKDISDLEWIK